MEMELPFPSRRVRFLLRQYMLALDNKYNYKFEEKDNKFRLMNMNRFFATSCGQFATLITILNVISGYTIILFSCKKFYEKENKLKVS